MNRLNDIFRKIKIDMEIALGNRKVNIEDIKKQNIFIFLAADYANLGDVAITFAQKKFLEDVFPNGNVIEIPANETYNYIKNIKKNIKKEDIITIIGGGNMSDMYEYYEKMRRTIIRKFPRNKIISFPQTISFSSTSQGKISLLKTKKCIKNHNDILILAREEKSYKTMINEFGKEKVMLVPDIVMYLKDKMKLFTEKKEKIGICFRNDLEKNKENDVCKEKLINLLKEYKTFDTHIGKFKYEKRYEELNKILNNISKMKFVITDRLHSMIFCYLTNTKCYFIDNNNKKISETYKLWLKDNENIKEISINNVNDICKEISNMKDYNVQYKNIDDKYGKLRNIIKERK